MVLFTVILILLTCYVAHSDIQDGTKTSYFIAVSVIGLLILLTSIF